VEWYIVYGTCSQRRHKAAANVTLTQTILKDSMTLESGLLRHFFHLPTTALMTMHRAGSVFDDTIATNVAERTPMTVSVISTSGVKINKATDLINFDYVLCMIIVKLSNSSTRDLFMSRLPRISKVVVLFRCVCTLPPGGRRAAVLIISRLSAIYRCKTST
jgi:hypothetical protein